MNVVIISPELFKGDLVSHFDFPGDFQNCFSDELVQQGFAVFHRKDDVVVGIIDAVMTSIKAHAFHYTLKT